MVRSTRLSSNDVTISIRVFGFMRKGVVDTLDSRIDVILPRSEEDFTRKSI
jgi:hypothetical protein